MACREGVRWRAGKVFVGAVPRDRLLFYLRLLLSGCNIEPMETTETPRKRLFAGSRRALFPQNGPLGTAVCIGILLARTKENFST